MHRAKVGFHRNLTCSTVLHPRNYTQFSIWANLFKVHCGSMLDAPSTHTSAQQYVLPLSLNKQSRLIVKMTWPFQPVHECLLVTVEGVAVSDAISLVALPGSSPHKSHVVHRKLTFNWTGIKQNPSVVENNFCIFPSFEENIDGASIISRSCLLKTTHSTERRPIDMTIIPLYNGSDHRYDDCS